MATYTPRYNLSKPENTDEMQSFMSDYADNMDKIDENLGGGGGSANIIELTQAEYDALPDTKLTDDTMYLIKDANSASDAEFTNVNGFFIDTNNVIASGTYVGSFSYTATQDCYFYGSIANSQNNSASITIDGVPVYSIYDSTVSQSGVVLPLKKGQVIALSTTFSQAATAYTIYGVQAGSNVTIIPDYASACYSTQEREVGCWVDGKPLYQKTVSFTVGAANAYNTYDTGIQNPETIMIEFGASFYLFSSSFIVGIEPYVYSGSNPASSEIMVATAINNSKIRLDYRNGSDVVGKTAYVVLRYTKTTDTAGSGQWTPMAQPTHHYSTEEQVIGTWIDGKPIYEITLNPTVAVGSNTVAHGIANFKECISIKGKCKYDNSSDVLPLPYVSTNAYYAIALGNVNATNYLIDVGAYFGSIQDCYVTIQYTKTTD